MRDLYRAPDAFVHWATYGGGPNHFVHTACGRFDHVPWYVRTFQRPFQKRTVTCLRCLAV